MAETVFTAIIKELDEQIDKQANVLLMGGVKDYPAYRESVGVVRGLRACRRYVEDLSQHYMDDNDD